MTNFNEADVARDSAGRFGEKHHSAPETTLEASPPVRAGARFADRERDFGGFSLSKVKTMRGREGTAWSADLKHNGKTVGLVIQDGNGGDTYTQWTDQEARKRMSSLGNSEDWSDHPYISMGAEGLILDELFAEHDSKKTLTAARRRGSLPVMLREHVQEAESLGGLSSYVTLSGSVEDIAGVREYLQARGQLDGARHFDGESWVPFE